MQSTPHQLIFGLSVNSIGESGATALSNVSTVNTTVKAGSHFILDDDYYYYDYYQYDEEEEEEEERDENKEEHINK